MGCVWRGGAPHSPCEKPFQDRDMRCWPPDCSCLVPRSQVLRPAPPSTSCAWALVSLGLPVGTLIPLGNRRPLSVHAGEIALSGKARENTPPCSQKCQG